MKYWSGEMCTRTTTTAAAAATAGAAERIYRDTDKKKNEVYEGKIVKNSVLAHALLLRWVGFYCVLHEL